MAKAIVGLVTALLAIFIMLYIAIFTTDITTKWLLCGYLLCDYVSDKISKSIKKKELK